MDLVSIFIKLQRGNVYLNIQSTFKNLAEYLDPSIKQTKFLCTVVYEHFQNSSLCITFSDKKERRLGQKSQETPTEIEFVMANITNYSL